MRTITGSKYVAPILGPLLVGIWTWERRGFLGDDLEVLVAFNEGKYLPSPVEAIRDVSLQKWRPINSLYLYATLKLFGESYEWYWILNYLLMTALAITVAFFVRRICRGWSCRRAELFAALSVLVVATSPFTFMQRIGIFGFLETAPVILIVVSYYLFTQSSSASDFIFSATFAIGAMLIHERFVVFAATMAILGVIRSRNDKIYRSSILPFAAIPFFYVYTTALVLKIDPLRGGGEAYLSASAGRWIVPRYLDAMLFLFGGPGGRTVFYSLTKDTTAWVHRISEPEGPWGTSIRTWSLYIAVTVVAIAFVSLYLSRKKGVREQVVLLSCKTPRSGVRTSELVAIGLVLLMPAATVISRIEMRWLLGSLVFGVLAFASGVTQLFCHTAKRVLVMAPLALLLIVGITNMNTFRPYNFFRENPYRLISVVDDLANGLIRENYVLVVNLSDKVGYLPWATANGEAFYRQVGRPPKEVRFFHESEAKGQDFCVEFYDMSCIVIRADSQSIAGEARFEVESLPE